MESIVNQKYSFCSAFSSEVLEETLRYELSLSFIYRNRSQSIRLDSITIVSIFLEWKLSFLFLPLRDLSSSIENGNKIARPYGIAIQFLFGSFCTAYVFIMYRTMGFEV